MKKNRKERGGKKEDEKGERRAERRERAIPRSREQKSKEGGERQRWGR